ncbi:rhomboid family intramembrane serine protease [Tamilnaduibacter salinus]|uniref:Rhomboid family intramembrane serine protease n=1 Tax=Tamilnaduibacter salinus TaxID=1484056 RepID=A0A2A2I5E4_9GAMM|nr:rhomboid family intramembrane serine protease [Tamilnaduibacter salinus]PAV26504.1 rhomboid family intramembrane serine protease [Tamilnaduibacter salinus]
MYRVKQLPGDADLSTFSEWLRQQGVTHRISSEGEAQILWLEDPSLTDEVLVALDQYMQRPDARRVIRQSVHSPVFVNGRWQPSPRHAPLVLGAIIVAAILAWVTGLGRHPSSTFFMFVDPESFRWDTLDQRLGAWSATLTSGQFWRLITPDFLHFSWSHIIFNSVMLWFLGSQVEWFDGKARLITLFIGISLLSNSLQYLASGPLFGGLSGVVYGILGYCWLSQQRMPRFQFPPALVVVALVWMLIGFTPLPVWLGIGRMANEAHLGGFVAGILLALLPPPRQTGS